MILNRSGALLLAAALAATTLPAIAAQERASESAAAELEAETAPTTPVELDGRRLFQVRGVSAYPAEQRAERIKNRIEALARNPDFGPRPCARWNPRSASRSWPGTGW